MENTTPPLTLRKARLADLPAILHLLTDDPLGSQRDTAGTQSLDPYLPAFEAIENNPYQYLMIAERNDCIIGTFQLTILHSLTYQGAGRAQIESVRVAADCRSQGIGQQMMEWAIETARREGCVLVQLTTHKSRTDAHRFYERLGFHATHEGMKLMLK